MASKRLTKSQKGNITVRLINKAYSERDLILKKEGFSLAERIWEFFYGEYKKEINALPNDWFARVSGFNIYDQNFVGVGPYRYSNSMYVAGSGTFPVPVDAQYGTPPKLSAIAAKDLALSSDLTSHYVKMKALKDEKDASKKEIEAILAGINTEKQLKDTWPELFTNKIVVDVESVSRSLPTIQTADLNKKLGLKKA